MRSLDWAMARISQVNYQACVDSRPVLAKRASIRHNDYEHVIGLVSS